MDAQRTQNGLTSINAWNKTEDPTKLGHCLHHLLEDAAKEYPANVALICGNATLNYQRLNEAANRFARVLVDLGVGPHDLVGVALDRSVGLVIVLVAVIKAGAAYVPLDTAFPPERIRHTLDVAAPKLLVVTASKLGAFESWAGVILSIDQDKLGSEHAHTQGSNLQRQGNPEDLAYVIFTSGSTGKPKGVDVSHGALCNLLLSMKDVLKCEAADRLLAVTTVTFDIAALELFLPLLCGATVILAQRQETKDAKTLRRLLEHHAVTMMQATPTSWQILLDSGWNGSHVLQKLLCGGEALPSGLAARLLACGGSLWNLYGPTEATVWASAWRVQPGQDIIIGKPLANYQLHLLDSELQPVPQGQCGELYIGGPCLARGYHKDPGLTRASFLDNPFGQGRIYRTGDIGCFLGTGRLRTTGRADGQVKVRGYRVELGDVETALASHPQVTGAVVVCRADQLIAYFTWGQGPSEAAGETCPEDAVLRQWVDGLLPPYMMPAFFLPVEAFPTTLNNKIDRKALPDPFASKVAQGEQPLASASAVASKSAKKVAAELERHVLATWCRVLGACELGLRDNFFHVGGNSVRLVQVQTQLEKLLNRPIPVAKLFEHYTIESLAAYLSGHDMVGSKQHDLPLRTSSATEDEDVAIVSMACRLPGEVSTPEEFWKLLQSGGDVISEVPAGRWNAATLRDAGPDMQQRPECMRGGFLSSIDSFDISFFGISPQEAREMDPVQLLTLETCWEGLERAGYPLEKLRGSRTGMFAGVSNMPAHQDFARPLADLNGYTATGSAGATVSGRVSHVLGLEGPSMTIDTACSSSLVATDLACASLRRGECNMAVACGTTLMQSPGLHVEFSRLGGSSRDGRCRAFSEDTDGTGWAEGSVAVVLKRISDARRDGDAIHAVVRGSAVNHGGRSAGLTTPSGPAQQQVIQRALMAARLQPSDIDYVEAHGTGTKLGDPIEGTALAYVFGGRLGGATSGDAGAGAGAGADDAKALWVGSAKSNIGHTQAAAGLVGVLKVVLSMQHGILPRTLHVATPTRAVDWREAGITLVRENRAWTRQGAVRLRRAGISSFGIGGTNAHVVIEEAAEMPARVEAEAGGVTEAGSSMPFLVSGDTASAVRQQAERLRRYLSSSSSSSSSSSIELGQAQLKNVAYSLATTRTHFKYRLALLATSQQDLLEQLATAAASPKVPTANAAASARDDRQLAMLFTGQGSQVAGMGRDLSLAYPVFRQSLETTASHFSLERPLLEVMWPDLDRPDDVALLHRTDYAQPAIFALQVALLHLWQSWGVEPRAVLGHSLGEYAAAFAAGVFDLDSACRLVQARSRLMQDRPPGSGRMVSLEASASEVASAIADTKCSGRVGIAACNTPSQTVISGDASAADAVGAYMAGLGRRVKPLDVSRAFHSHHMNGMIEEFEAILKEVQFQPCRIPVVSSVTGRLAEPGLLETPRYWATQVRQAVRFSDAMQTLVGMGLDVFIELGARPVLSGMGKACMDIDQKPLPAWLPSLAARKSGPYSMQSSLAHLHQLGISVDWSGYFQPFECRRVELPTYAFQRKRVLSPVLSRVLPKPRYNAEEATSDTSSPNTTASQSELDPCLENDLGSMLRSSPREDWNSLVQGKVCRIVASLVGTESVGNVDMDVAWKDMGVDSLMEPQLRSQLVALAEVCTDEPLPRDIASTCPTVMSFCSHLISSFQKHSDHTFSPEKKSVRRPFRPWNVASSLDAALDGISQLAESLPFRNASHIQWPPKSVFITGATGFVGAFLLHQLLDRGVTAHCLVRTSDPAHAMEGLEATLGNYDLWKDDYKPSLRPVMGDLAHPLFGLSQEAFDQLSEQIDAICHLQGWEGGYRPTPDLIMSDLVGTYEVLHLASVGRGKPIHLISTRNVIQHGEDDGCRNAKFMIERIVAGARSRGAIISIFRLPSAFASSKSGHFGSGSDNLLHLLIVGSLLMGKFPSLDGDLSAWMPVDYLCKSVASAVTQRRSFLNHDVDFASQQPSLSLKHVFSTLSAADKQQYIVPLDEWRRCLAASAVAQPTGHLAHLAGIFSQVTDQSMRVMFKVPLMNQRSSWKHHAWADDIHPMTVIDGTHLRRYLAQIRLQLQQTNGNQDATTIDTPKQALLDGVSVLKPVSGISVAYPVALSPLRRILCPSLGFYPPNSCLDRFTSALEYFSQIPWCAQLMNELSPTHGPIPGRGQAIAFLPHCFNPASSQHEQFIGQTLSREHVHATTDGEAFSRGESGAQPPLRHMLCCFRPSNPDQLQDPAQPILRVVSLVALGAGTSGFEGIVHGGLIATILDESLSIVHELNSALGKAGPAFRTVHVTASLNVEYVAPLPVTEEVVCVTAQIEKWNDRRAIMKGNMVNSIGKPLARVNSTWVGVPE